MEIKHPEADDTVASVSNIAQLAAAGYRTPDEQVQELTSYNVTTQNIPGGTGLGLPLQSPMLRDLHTRYAPTMLWPAARTAFDRTCAIRDYHSLLPQQPALSRDELDALRHMTTIPGLKDVSRLAEVLQGPLKAAMGTEPEDGGRKSREPPLQPRCKTQIQDNPRMSEIPTAA